MSFEQLVRQLKPTFLNAASQVHCQPFVLFLAASDMKVRAITRHAVADDPAAAWDIAVQELRSALGSIKPTILRADWVRSTETITWQEFLNLIGKTRRNYFRKGIALDLDFKIAFTECELNGNTMLYKDGKDGNKNCVFRDDRCDEYCRTRFNCEFPRLEPNDMVTVFETVGAFVADDKKEPLMITGTGLNAGHRDVSNIDDEAFLRMARSGAAYLANEVKPNGRFIYGHYPCLGRVVPSYNTLRHFSSIFAMLDVYETYGRMGNSKLGAAINKALKYGLKTFIQYRTLDDGTEAAYPVDMEGNEIKLGALGMCLVALTKHAALMKTQKNLPLMEALARGIWSMQQPDGSFVHVLNSSDYSLKEQFRIVYYDGEAVFGMMRLYAINHDERLLAASELAFKRFIATNHWQNHDHWLSYAVNELTNYQPKREYFEFGINNFLDFLPFVYHRDTQFPTLLELMMAADTMIERMKQMPEMADLLARVPLDDFYAAMENRAKNLLNGHFYPELAMFFKIPGIINGSFFIRHHAFRVRTDDVEHFLSGFVAYRRYLAHRDHEPIPSQELVNGKAEGTGLINRQMSEGARAEAIITKNESASTIEIDPNAPTLQELVDAQPREPDIAQFVEEFNRKNGMIFFMLRALRPKAPGVEFSAFRRAQMFKKYFGCDVRFVTNDYQGDAVYNLANYGLHNPILNMYDHYQEIDRYGTPERLAQLPEIGADCLVEYRDADLRISRNGKLVMYCGFEPATQKLRYINYFDGGKKVRRDTYDMLGFLGRHQILDLETSQPLEAFYYRPDGSLAFKETCKIVNKESVVESCEVIDRDGQIVRSFQKHEDALCQWLFDMFKSETHTCFIIGDRTPEYTKTYIRLKEDAEFNANNYVCHQIHNVHFNTNTGAPAKRYQFLTTTKLKDDAILALTKQQWKDIVDQHHVRNIVTLPHPLPPVEPQPRTDFDPFRVVQAGRFVPEKGQLKSIEAFRRVLEKIPQATLHFYGTGKMQKDIQQKIDEYGLNESVFIEGFTSNIHGVFANSALSLLPSTIEGFPLVIQESLLNGCPVVAFDCTYGPRDGIEDGVTGYIVPVNDIDALADRIIRVLSDPELQHKLSLNAAESAKRFSQENVIKKWVRLFNVFMHRGEAQ